MRDLSCSRAVELLGKILCGWSCTLSGGCLSDVSFSEIQNRLWLMFISLLTLHRSRYGLFVYL